MLWSWYTGCWLAVIFGTARRGLSMQARSPSSVPNVTAHSSTAACQLPYCCIMNGPLLSGFNMPVKGLNVYDTVWFAELTAVEITWLPTYVASVIHDAIWSHAQTTRVVLRQRVCDANKPCFTVVWRRQQLIELTRLRCRVQCWPSASSRWWECSNALSAASHTQTRTHNTLWVILNSNSKPSFIHRHIRTG